MEYKLFQCFR